MNRKGDDHTLDMFEIPTAESHLPGSANYAFEVSILVSDLLKNIPDDRWVTAANMSRLSGDDVSKNMLDAWASPARTEHNVPFYRVPLLEEVAGAHMLTDWLVAKRGGRVAYGRDVLNAKLGKLTVMKQQMEQQIRELKKLMGEME